MFAFKTTDAAEILAIPASKLRYWRKQLRGPWSHREDQRLAWPEVLALAIVGQYCEDRRLEIGVFSDAILDLVVLCRDHEPEQLAQQRLLFEPGAGQLRLVPHSENVYDQVVDGNWIPLDLQKVVESIRSRLFNGELVTDTDALRSAA